MKKEIRNKSASLQGLRIMPLTPGRWDDLVRLFGERGACAGCWCMWWRLKRSIWSAQKGEGNKRALKALVEQGKRPGLLAYLGKTPVGWCAVAPREEYIALEKSRILKRVDDLPVWSVVCFFIARPYRRLGVTSALLKAAVELAARNGAVAVEGYPTDPKSNQPDVFVFTGLLSAFRKAGFREVARRSPGRPIMRYLIETPGKK